MSLRYTHDLVAVVGTYTDQGGQEKKRFHTCGKYFQREDGSAAVKIESLPVGPDWSGWLNLYPRKPRGQEGLGGPGGQGGQGGQGGYPPPAPTQARNAANMAMQAPPPASTDAPPAFDDDIPF